MYRLLRCLAQILIRPFYRIRIIGRETMPMDGCILCANHISYFDPICLGLALKRPICFMAKSELFTQHGFFAREFLKRCGVFAVRRGSADTQAIDKAVQLLKQGKMVGIFPQGGIVRKIPPVRTKAGAALLAAKEQLPLWPAVIYAEGKIRPFVRITVRFGAPLTAEGKSLSAARALNHRLQEALQALWEEGHGN